MICLSGHGEVGTLQSLACLAIENLVRKSLDQVGKDGDGHGDDDNMVLVMVRTLSGRAWTRSVSVLMVRMVGRIMMM